MIGNIFCRLAMQPPAQAPAPDLPAVHPPAPDLPVVQTKKRSRTALTIAVKLEL